MAEAIALIDYGAGNLHSVHNALRAAGAERVAVTSDPAIVLGARRVVLPGVGSFKADRGHEHGATPGLGWIAGEVRLIERTDPAIKVPHMGWNDVSPAPHRDGASLIAPGEAYFLHSYHFRPENGRDIAAMTDHGGGLVAAVARDNIVGVQFHPEKSQAYGLALLARFLEWNP